MQPVSLMIGQQIWVQGRCYREDGWCGLLCVSKLRAGAGKKGTWESAPALSPECTGKCDEISPWGLLKLKGWYDGDRHLEVFPQQWAKSTLGNEGWLDQHKGDSHLKGSWFSDLTRRWQQCPPPHPTPPLPLSSKYFRADVPVGKAPTQHRGRDSNRRTWNWGVKACLWH